MYSVSDRFGNPHRAPAPIRNPVGILENQHTRLPLEHPSNGLDAQTPKLAQLRGRVVAFRNSRICLVLLHTLRRDGQDSFHAIPRNAVRTLNNRQARWQETSTRLERAQPSILPRAAGKRLGKEDALKSFGFICWKPAGKPNGLPAQYKRTLWKGVLFV
jgi:hypothetical protein